MARSTSIHVAVLLALLYVNKGLEHVFFYDLPSFVALFSFGTELNAFEFRTRNCEIQKVSLFLPLFEIRKIELPHRKMKSLL